MQVVFSAQAEADFLEIYAKLSHMAQRAGDDFSSKLASRLDQLTSLPFMGRPRPKFGADLRSLLVSPYLVIYRIRERIEVVRLLHGSRDLEAEIKRST